MSKNQRFAEAQRWFHYIFDPTCNDTSIPTAGIDIGSIVNGLNRPIGPIRCLTMIQKALELCNEVRSLGGALISALEKTVNTSR
jgi:hypothetical protein